MQSSSGAMGYSRLAARLGNLAIGLTGKDRLDNLHYPGRSGLVCSL